MVIVEIIIDNYLTSYYFILFYVYRFKLMDTLGGIWRDVIGGYILCVYMCCMCREFGGRREESVLEFLRRF